MENDKNEELSRLGIMTPGESNDLELRMNTIQETAANDIAKYFDRINDKLFSYNNMLIAGYFALIAVCKLHYLYLVVPLLNMAILISVDWYMMEYKRIESRADANPPIENRIGGQKSGRATLLSLLTIITTFFITVMLILFLGENIACFCIK